ncbi:MAG TPA: AcvB/VirJ family lysyl-phosphatidylglycerol hydrolase [Candidatus Polarisedimenticolaceae bacterium]|nr:AcvB/VirJ family lysyl-phosphatidylglycerol hydrolase [Candidatus Polarisedimenticolaceae bacterium]
MILTAALLLSAAVVSSTKEEVVKLPGFAAVHIYRPDPLDRARGVVLFVSGDGGWNSGVVEMARRLAPHALVAGLSMPAWQKSAEKGRDRCWYPAGELEVAAQALEKHYALPRYVPPILVGYSSGATVVYGALAQAPSTTFAGGVSLGFCPDLEVARPLCGQGDWKPSYDPRQRKGWLPEKRDLASAWHVLQGAMDQVCSPSGTAGFVQAIPSAHLAWLEKVGHGFGLPARWGAAFDGAVAALLEPAGLLAPPPAASPSRFDALGLPLEVSWPEGAKQAVIFVSGDGGWADLDRTVARDLAADGIAVIGWNTLRYFWSAKTAEHFRHDLARVVEAIPAEMSVAAGGFSFGAEVVPAALAAGPRNGALARVSALVLLAPGTHASYEVSPLDWVGAGGSSGPSVADALARLQPLPVLCMDGSEEDASGCHGATAPAIQHVGLPGGHHFGGDFHGLADRIARFLR